MTQLTFAKDWIGKEYLPFTCGKEIVVAEWGRGELAPNETETARNNNNNMILFVLYVVLTFESIVEILWCDHSNETSSAVFSHGTICFVCSSNFLVSG